MDITFKVIIKDKEETTQWNVPYLSWSFTEELNNDKNASFSFSFAQLKKTAEANFTTPLNMIYGSLRWVEIYKNINSIDTILYKGYLRGYSKSRGDSDYGNVSLGSKGIMGLLDKRKTNDFVVRPEQTFFSNNDLSDIAWDLINYTQGRDYGNLGITQGTNPVTRNAQRTYYYNYIGEAINDLSNKNRKNGFDFEIDNLKRFNVFYPFKGSNNGVSFTDGIDILSYDNLERPSVDDLVNECICKSNESFGFGSLIATSSGSNANKNAYGLLEEVISDSATQLSTIQEKADDLINKKENPYIKVDIKVNGYSNSKWDNVSVGDIVLVTIADEEINQTFRVYKKSLDSNNIETYSLSEDINT